MMPVLRGLQTIRERRLLSRHALAERAGMTEKTIYNLERGRPARWTTARKLVDALGCHPADLLDPPRARGGRPPTRHSTTPPDGVSRPADQHAPGAADSRHAR
ncbi:MAG: helix-turn-helix transcriptional regulator [Chloroflexi bacterium]|nr:helix-turn-helix transcriptional regulator [Chloroflexota bacterium]